MTFKTPGFIETGNKAKLVRRIELKSVLLSTGAVQDKNDKNKWHTARGILSVSGPKFMNWNQNTGGGGAIDLIMHLKNISFKPAVLWLWDHFPGAGIQTSSSPVCVPPPGGTGREVISPARHIFKLPVRDDAKLSRVSDYLINDRHIPFSIINLLIQSGILYADIRSNAVFLLLGKEKSIVGAELRGTGSKPWRGMAPGSRKDLGCFYVKNAGSKKKVLCESAIDAISCYCIHPDYRTLSTSGANPDPVWLKSLINRGYEIWCGFDGDETGDKMAEKMIKLYPTVKRLRPAKHDWNDLLKSKI